MRWRKLGIVYRPDGSRPWAHSHAMVPTPVALNAAVIRVYVSFCDRDFVSRPGYVDVDASDPLRVIGVSQEPLLEVGTPGTFDENGVLACSVVALDAQTRYLYYVGFEQGTKIRYRLLTGLAISRDRGRTFTRHRRTPVLERSDAELYFRGGPWVLVEDGRFRLWYVAGSEWTVLSGKPMPVYNLRYQESIDGIAWADRGRVCLEITDPDEHAIGRPCVVHGEQGYELHLSVRKRSLGEYRLGYATSSDGLSWTRRDQELGLDISESGWDSAAIMYSAVIRSHGKTWLFYNGNNFGEDGFGVAVREDA